MGVVTGAFISGDVDSLIDHLVAEAVREVAMPTAPDGYSFIPADEISSEGEEVEALLRQRIALWRPDMTWFRVTSTMGDHARAPFPEGVWIEAWRRRPTRAAEFCPPLVAP